MQKKNESPEINRKKYPRYYYGIALLLPFLFLFLLEIVLRVSGYGNNVDQWVPVSEERQDLVVLNPDIAMRWFRGMDKVPTSIYDPFAKVKGDETFRIFILGESSAAGFPFSPTGGFSRYLEQRLRLMYPVTDFEIVNTGIAAINTFAIKDMLPGILEQQPDLLLIYTGHNEWYGALGAASTGEGGGFLVDLRMFFDQFKIFQMFSSVFESSPDNAENHTGGGLMRRMAETNLVPFDSPLYGKGYEQFRKNMSEILSEINAAGVPVIMSTLASNLKDQPPFETVQQKRYPRADSLYEQGKREYRDSNYTAALETFRYARDYDALRFRAPGEFNDIIRDYAKDYNCTLIDAEVIFNETSPGGITGGELMTDHLHPTLAGYQLLGALFYNAVVNTGLLPDMAYAPYTDTEQDSIVKSNFPFSALDSTMASMRLAVIMNDYPFTKEPLKVSPAELIQRRNKIDTLAFSVVTGNKSWYKAHIEAAQYYLSRKRFDLYAREYRAVTSQYWFRTELFRHAAEILIDNKAYSEAALLLRDAYREVPDAFNTKWLGNIALFKGEFERAARYLLESTQFDDRDAQTYYNLSGAYAQLQEYNKALAAIENCLRLDPGYPQAAQLKQQLLREVEK